MVDEGCSVVPTSGLTSRSRFWLSVAALMRVTIGRSVRWRDPAVSYSSLEVYRSFFRGYDSIGRACISQASKTETCGQDPGQLASSRDIDIHQSAREGFLLYYMDMKYCS